jgi:hypothetical protein
MVFVGGRSVGDCAKQLKREKAESRKQKTESLFLKGNLTSRKQKAENKRDFLG